MNGHFNNESFNVVGMYYAGIRSKKSLSDNLSSGDPLTLSREPTNRYDRNAIMVYSEMMDRIGYMPRGIAARLAPILDRDCEYECHVTGIAGKKNSPQIIAMISTQAKQRPPTGTIRAKGGSGCGIKEKQTPATLTGKTFRRHSDIAAWFDKHDGHCGLYLIWNINNKGYVGQSRNIGRRWKEHYRELTSRTHENARLQDEWTQAGERYFRFDILEETSQEKLDDREQFYIDTLGTYRFGYNTTQDGRGKVVDTCKKHHPAQGIHHAAMSFDTDNIQDDHEIAIAEQAFQPGNVGVARYDDTGEMNYPKSPTSVSSAREKNFIEKLSAGDFGLTKTYWLYGVLIETIATLIVSVITSSLAASPSLSGAFWFPSIVFVAYDFSVKIGTWKAADKYHGPKLWAVLAKSSVIIGAIVLAITLPVIGLLKQS